MIYVLMDSKYEDLVGVVDGPEVDMEALYDKWRAEKTGPKPVIAGLQATPEELEAYVTYKYVENMLIKGQFVDWLLTQGYTKVKSEAQYL